MSGESDVQVKFGAQIEGLLAGVAEGKAALTEFSDQVAGSLQKVNLAFEAMAAIMAGSIFAGFVSEANDAITQTYQLSQRLGITMEAASGLRVALGNVGLSTEDYLGVMTRMNRQMKAHEDAFNSLGVKTRDANNQFLNQQVIYQNAIAVLETYKAGTDRNQVAMRLFGGRVGDLTGLMRLNTDAIREGSDEAKKLGLIFGEDAVKGVLKYKESIALAEEASLSIKVKIAQELQPTLVGLSKWLETEGPTAANAFTSAMQGILVAVTLLITGIKQLASGFDYLKERMAIWSEEKLSFFPDLGKIDSELAALEKTYSAAGAKIAKDGKTAYYAIFGLDENGNQLPVPDIHLPGSGTKDAPDADSLKSGNGGGKGAKDDTVTLYRQDIADQMQLDRVKLEAKKSLLQEEVDAGQITNSQKLAALRGFADDEYKIQLAALQDEEKLGSLSEAQWNKIQDQKELIAAQHDAAIEKLNMQSVLEQKKQYDQLFTGIKSAMDGMVSGILQGTQTLTQALARMVDNIGVKFAQMAANDLLDWTRKQLLKVAVHQTANDQIAASDATAAAAGNPVGAAKMIKEIESSAATTYAGVFAFMSPELGPAAAIPAGIAAGTVGAMAGLVSLDVGAWNLPTDTIAQLHQGEMVVPQNFAQGIRDGSGFGGQSSGSSVTININAIDTQTGMQFLKNNAAGLAQIMNGQARNFNPALRVN